ncbi:MAG: hypothetical protein ACRESZ_22220 [Methylococcales bacterium]
MGKIDWETYETTKAKNRRREPSDRGDPYKTFPIRNSRRLTRILVANAMSGHTMLREAARLLNVRPGTVMELSKRLEMR